MRGGVECAGRSRRPPYRFGINAREQLISPRRNLMGCVRRRGLITEPALCELIEQRDHMCGGLACHPTASQGSFDVAP